MHHHYGTPGYHYYRRGPSRLWWFFLGGAAVAFWQYKSQQRWNEGERRGWFCGGSSRRREIQDERPTTNSWSATPLPPPTREELEAQKREPEPLWRLRSEKEAERRRQEQEAEFRDDLDRAREKVLSVTESGLQSLRQSLDNLTRMIQDQRRDRPSRDPSPDSEKRE